MRAERLKCEAMRFDSIQLCFSLLFLWPKSHTSGPCLGLSCHPIIDGGSEWNFERSWVGRICSELINFSRDNWRRRLSKIIKWLKLAGKGARGVFKDGAWACWLKFWKQMILSVAWFAHENSRRRLCEMIGRLKPTVDGVGQQFPGWIVWRAQWKFESKRYEVIGSA